MMLSNKFMNEKPGSPQFNCRRTFFNSNLMSAGIYNVQQVGDGRVSRKRKNLSLEKRETEKNSRNGQIFASSQLSNFSNEFSEHSAYEIKRTVEVIHSFELDLFVHWSTFGTAWRYIYKNQFLWTLNEMEHDLKSCFGTSNRNNFLIGKCFSWHARLVNIRFEIYSSRFCSWSFLHQIFVSTIAVSPFLENSSRCDLRDLRKVYNSLFCWFLVLVPSLARLPLWFFSWEDSVVFFEEFFFSW